MIFNLDNELSNFMDAVAPTLEGAFVLPETISERQIRGVDCTL